MNTANASVEMPAQIQYSAGPTPSAPCLIVGVATTDNGINDNGVEKPEERAPLGTVIIFMARICATASTGIEARVREKITANTADLKLFCAHSEINQSGGA